MHKATVAVLLCSLFLITTAPPPPATGQATDTRFETLVDITDAVNTKYPRIAPVGNTLHIGGSLNEKATYWTMPDTGNTMSPGGQTGDALSGNKNPQYANTTIAAGPDGAIYMVWISQGSGIYMRKKPAGGDWEAQKKVVDDSNFMAYVDASVAPDNSIAVVWNEGAAVHYRFSNNGGTTWSGGVASSQTPRGHIFVSSGPGSPFTAIYAAGDGSKVYALRWNGTGWATEIVAQGGAYKADPSGSTGPDGRNYAVWREVGGDIQFAERQPNGTWTVSTLADGESNSYVWIYADAQNNLHAAWAGNASGNWDYWYAYRPAGGAWQTPFVQPGNGKILADATVTGTIGSRVYGHMVMEYFAPGTGAMNLRYLRFSSSGGVSAKAVIESGAAVTNKQSLSVQLTELQGSPNQVRYHWDSAPTDADTWQTFDSANAVLSVSAPSDVSRASCQKRNLYVQVRKDEGFAGSATASAITFDLGVQADIRAMNLYMPVLPPLTASGVRLQDTIDQQGAWNGSPNYTRTRQAFLNIRDAGDCSGLSSFSVTNSIASEISSTYNAIIPLPGDTSPGPKQVQVTLTDKLNNTTTYTTEIVYDPRSTDPVSNTNTAGLPVVSDTLTGTVDAQTSSIMRTLSFSSVSVTDNLYGKQGENLPDGQQFWGVWIANSRSDVAPDDTSLNYYALPVSTPSSSFTVSWNLFNGLNYGPATDKSGAYFIYVRFLDGAGNPSATALKLQAQLDPGYRVPQIALPVVRKPAAP
jgi:hypothetical protein